MWRSGWQVRHWFRIACSWHITCIDMDDLFINHDTDLPSTKPQPCRTNLIWINTIWSTMLPEYVEINPKIVKNRSKVWDMKRTWKFTNCEIDLLEDCSHVKTLQNVNNSGRFSCRQLLYLCGTIQLPEMWACIYLIRQRQTLQVDLERQHLKSISI